MASHLTDDPSYSDIPETFVVLVSDYASLKFSQHWGGPVFPKLWVLGFRKNQDLADITLRSSNMRKN